MKYNLRSYFKVILTLSFLLSSAFVFSQKYLLRISPSVGANYAHFNSFDMEFNNMPKIGHSVGLDVGIGRKTYLSIGTTLRHYKNEIKVYGYNMENNMSVDLLNFHFLFENNYFVIQNISIGIFAGFGMDHYFKIISKQIPIAEDDFKKNLWLIIYGLKFQLHKFFLQPSFEKSFNGFMKDSGSVSNIVEIKFGYKLF